MKDGGDDGSARVIKNDVSGVVFMLIMQGGC